MANRAYIVPRRTDLNGVNLQILDLVPNTSQRSSTYDGDGQTGYIKYSFDAPGTTRVSGNSYVSGSMTTSPLSATAVEDVGGTDLTVTTTAEFGLGAYLRERVNVNPGGDNDIMTPGEAEDVVGQIVTRVYNGQSLTVADINAILNDVLAGADNSLDGTDGAGAAVVGSESFGSLEDVLRILTGEAYLVKAGTVLGDDLGEFGGLGGREVLVDGVDGYYAQGAFLVAGEAGYRDVKKVALTGALRSSVREGNLSKLVGDNTVKIVNPAFAYTAGAVRHYRPRALRLSGANVSSDGDDKVLVVYDQDGNVLS